MDFAVIFDLDGVIVNNANYHQKAWEVFCKRHTVEFSTKKFKSEFFGKTNEKVLPELFRRDLSKQEIQKLSEEKEQIYREIYQPHLKPVNGLIPFLKSLDQNNIPAGVATSAPKANVAFLLDGLDIRKFFKVIVDDSMVKHGKPHPEIYVKAAKMLKIKPKNCIVFEDSIAGTKSARDAGSKVIALTTTLPAQKHKYADKIISDFTEVSVQLIKSV